MSGETDLRRLLDSLSADLQPGRYVFTTVARVLPDLAPVVIVREPEGVTLVLDQDEAERNGLAYEYVAAMVTLRVHSSLEAVGLTAAVATALTERGISCNVVSGYYHEHLFVPFDRGQETVDVLTALSRA